MHVLVVEDEKKVAAFIEKGLREEGITVTLAYDGLQARPLWQRMTFDVVILDIMMPRMDGLSLLKQMRAEKSHTPVLMLTARDAISDRVTGLQSGADDYLIKPFAFDELVARIHALARRGGRPLEEVLQVADLKMDLQRHRVSRQSILIDLTPLEFRLLEFLMRNQGRVLSRTSIEDHIWNLNIDRGSNVVDVYINYLRKKVDAPFDDPLIHTVRGVGYTIKKTGE
ncbi:response regulator [candidate division KSB1 bacterium]|nr:response regulator [candidate division KSB1 bacterium]